VTGVVAVESDDEVYPFLLMASLTHAYLVQRQLAKLSGKEFVKTEKKIVEQDLSQ